MIAWRIMAWVAVVGFAIAAVQTWRLRSLQLEVAQAEVQRAEDMREAERAARRSVEVVADDTHRALTRARADAAAARNALDGLRDTANTAAAACTSPSATPAGPAASTPGMVLADVLGSAGARATELAAALDAAYAAGIGCERAYQSVTAP